MILFLDDWKNYPNAIIDYQTPNKSFIRYASLLKTMGVKNHAFCLALLDPLLQGVDPFDPTLSAEMMGRIALECRSNFWYFLRTIARTKDGDPFLANRGNIALYWLFFNHITTLLIQIRQTGKSFSTDTLMNWLLNIRCRKTEINLLTKDDTLRAANLSRLKEIMFQLPFYLKQHRQGYDVGNSELLTVKALENRYKGHLPNKSTKLALNVGRGLTSPIFQIDEASFFFNIAISMPAALAAGTAERDKARRDGNPYGTIITTTAGKKDDRDGAYVYNMVLDSAVWSEAFMDALNQERLYDMVMKASPKRDLIVNCTFNHRQLGYTDEWLKRAIKEARAVGEDADRDFGNVWTSGTMASPLSVETSTLIRGSQVDDPYVEISPICAYTTRWYVPPERKEHVMTENDHIMSLDTSDAAGRDDIGMVLRSVRTGEVVAAGNYNETNLIKFSEWLVEWFVKYPRFVLIIERRSSGAMIVDYLLLHLVAKGIDPFQRIFNKIVQNHEEEPELYREICKPMYARSPEIYTRNKRAFGFTTSGTGSNARSELYGNTFLNAAKLTGDRVRDRTLINQILGLVIKGGRIDHSATGGKDDMVIAWNMSMWLMLSGKNLKHYGISSRDILSDNRSAQVTMSPRAQYDQQQQDYVRSQVEEVVNELKHVRDDYLASRLEAKLRALEQQLSNEDRQYLSMDELLVGLREQRRGVRSLIRHH